MFQVQCQPVPNAETRALIDQCIGPSEQIVYFNYSISTDTLTTCTMDCKSDLIIRQSSRESKSELRVKSDGFQILGATVNHVFLEAGDAFMVFKRPFAIYFITRHQQHPIRLALKETVEFQTMLVEEAYPSLVIYGKEVGQLTSKVLEMNLETLALRVRNDGTGYSPGPRRQQLSVMVDGRIYVFGGTDKEGKPCDKMIYVHDIEKGYWFALEMDYPDDQHFGQCETIVLSAGRVLVVSKSDQRAWVLEIHQSRLTPVQGQVAIEGGGKCVRGQIVIQTSKQWKYWGNSIVSATK